MLISRIGIADLIIENSRILGVGFASHYLFTNKIGAFIIEKNIFASLCLLSKKSPADFVGLSGNVNKIFTGERHVQDEYNPRLNRLIFNDCDPLASFFLVTIYL
jgi:hypothetical protein